MKLNQLSAIPLALNAVLVDDAAKLLKDQRRAANSHGPHGTTEPEADDMIHIGDQYVSQAASTPATPSIAGPLVKGLLGAGLLATGVGAPVGAWLIADAMKSAAKPAVQTVIHDVQEWDTKVEMKVRPTDTPAAQAK